MGNVPGRRAQASLAAPSVDGTCLHRKPGESPRTSYRLILTCGPRLFSTYFARSLPVGRTETLQSRSHRPYSGIHPFCSTHITNYTFANILFIFESISNSECAYLDDICVSRNTRATICTALDGQTPAAHLSPTAKCLTLLGTRGHRDAWNVLERSVGHRVIPLPGPSAVRKLPMVLRLVDQLGVEVDAWFQDSAEPIIDIKQKTYNVLYIGEACDSPYVPAQDFVAQSQVRSVLGFGGLHPRLRQG